MDLLLRELQSSGAIGAFVDRELSGDKITIGCANDQLIQLLGEEILGRHAILSPSGGGARIKTTGRHTVEVNGKRMKSAHLSVGDTLRIGGHTLVMSTAPAGFDAAIELTLDPDVDPATFEQAFRTGLTDTWLSKRALAWTLSIALLVFGLLIPLALVFDGDEATPDAQATLFTDVYWTSGPLHPAHNQSIGNDCGACHT